jgi:hypothetical protein
VIGGPQETDVVTAHDAKAALGHNIQVPDRAARKHEGFESEAMGAMHARRERKVVARL